MSEALPRQPALTHLAATPRLPLQLLHRSGQRAPTAHHRAHPPPALRSRSPPSFPQDKVKLLINGEFVDSATSDWLDVRNPATQEVVARLPLCTEGEFNAAVAAAKEAFPKWRATPVAQRARVMLKLQHLINENMGELAAAVTREQGKTLADARGDVFRGLGETGGTGDKGRGWRG